MSTLLELQALSCGYADSRVVHDLSLQVGSGELVALLGANGAGKTSTLMCIAGHVEQHGGRILLDDRDIATIPARARVEYGIALAPEGRRLFADLSVAENLSVGAYSQPAAVRRQQRDYVLALFPRLEERLKQLAGSLSGGEQQMLAIGRALMAKPRLLLIDELSLGLMPKVIDQCYQALERLRAEGIAVLLVEQNTERALSAADHVCVLESGLKVWQGTAEQARADGAMLDAYLGL